MRSPQQLIWEIQKESRVKRKLDKEALNSILSPQLKRLESQTDKTKKLFNNLFDLVIEGLANKIDYLVASHGDFGFGNIFVEAKSGKLEGVIDWDTGSLEELPGIDFFNLLTQVERATEGNDLTKAMLNVLMSDNTFSCKRELAIYGVNQDDIKYLIYASFLRYALRAAQYPEVFNKELVHYEHVFNRILQQEKNHQG